MKNKRNIKGKIRSKLRCYTIDLNRYLEEVIEYNSTMRRRKIFSKIHDLISLI